MTTPVSRRYFWNRPQFIWLGSVWLAVPLIIVIGAALAVGTWCESRFGIPAAQHIVYKSIWFFFLLLFLAVNLAVAALRRWPWKPHHRGFVMVHAGIISILFGGLIGLHFGVQGELIIPEGEATDQLKLEEKFLFVHQPNPGVHAAFATGFEARRDHHEPNVSFALSGEGRDYALVVDRYFPNAVAQEMVRPGPEGQPAVRLTAIAGTTERSIWLWRDDSEKSIAQWGPAHLGFLDEALFGSPKKSVQQDSGTLVLTFPWGDPHRIQVKESLGRELPLKNTPYTLLLQKYFTDLIVGEHGVENRSDQPRNPAVVFTLKGPDVVDTQIAFARAPGFSDAHGIEKKIPVQAVFEHDISPASWPENFLGVVQRSDGSFESVVTDEQGKVLSRKPAEVGGQITHPTLGISAKISDYLPSAERDFLFQNGPTNEVKNPVLRVQVSSQGRQESVWLPEGTKRTVRLDDHPLVLEYRSKTLTLPFSVKLVDFRKKNYPGTSMAASFESDVELTDLERGITMKRLINMNNPLKHRGFTLFQASYSESPVETTVLSVRKDPGVPLVYTGFLTVVAGLLTMFYWKPKK